MWLKTRIPSLLLTFTLVLGPSLQARAACPAAGGGSSARALGDTPWAEPEGCVDPTPLEAKPGTAEPSPARRTAVDPNDPNAPLRSSSEFDGDRSTRRAGFLMLGGGAALVGLAGYMALCSRYAAEPGQQEICKLGAIGALVVGVPTAIAGGVVLGVMALREPDLSSSTASRRTTLPVGGLVSLSGRF